MENIKKNTVNKNKHNYGPFQIRLVRNQCTYEVRKHRVIDLGLNDAFDLTRTFTESKNIIQL